MSRHAGFGVWLLVVAFAMPGWCQTKPTVAVWMSPGSPWGIWEKAVGDPFPAQRILGDLADLGVNEVLFFEQAGRGGPFLHPTSVPYAATDKRMKGRDFLEELLSQADQRGMKVWLAWTTPGGKYPGTDFEGLNHPEILRLYMAEIDEVARYRRHASLAGILWHEVDCTEAIVSHEADVAEFADYCQKTFGERYTGKKMPGADADSRWWRRHFLYRCSLVNNLVARSVEAAKRHGMEVGFCAYTPESFAGDSWRWGYDIVALERLCNRIWFSAYGSESGKPYQRIKGAWLDFGPSYRGQILARNYSYAMHGLPLCFFEYRAPQYIDEMRRYYSGIKSFASKYGDIYTGYSGHSPKEVELFYGKENLKRWVTLMTAWQGGSPTADVAVAVNPNAFVMAHPQVTGGEYDKRVRRLMLALSENMDVDGLVLGSRFALDPANLARYRLIVIPEDMGRGLTPAMADSLRQYVAVGGKLLLIATPLTTAKADLTEEKDLTREFADVEIRQRGLPGYVTAVPTNFHGAAGKFWTASRVEVQGEAKPLVTDTERQPLLLSNGKVAMFTIGFTPEASSLFVAVTRHMGVPSVWLQSDCGMRILEGTVHNGTACISLWGQGRATLHVDASRLPLPSGATCQVRDFVTGTVLGDFDRQKLLVGVPIEVKHVYQPMILGVGTATALAQFPPLYPSADALSGMKLKADRDNPEVPEEAVATVAEAKPIAAPAKARECEIAVIDGAPKNPPPGKRPNVGSRDAALKALRSWDMKPELVGLDIFLAKNKAKRDRCRRLLIPSGCDLFSQEMFEGMNDYVQSGGLLITNSSAVILDRNGNQQMDEGDGVSDYAKNHFLGVLGHGSCIMARAKVAQACPLTEGLPEGEWMAMDPPTGGRRTRNVSAEVVMRCVGQAKEHAEFEQPFLTYKHQGNGACVYLVGQMGSSVDPRLVQLLRNACSAKTLQWLCQ
jgi:hypothetical protein